MRNRLERLCWAFIYGLAIAGLVMENWYKLADPGWVPVHDSLYHFAKLLYMKSAFDVGELPLWNSYLYTGQPVFVANTNFQALDPWLWIWFGIAHIAGLSGKNVFVLKSLTESIFFAWGGALFAHAYTKKAAAGPMAFAILLFCGDAIFWPNQSQSFSLYIYVPWVFWALYRYVEGPSWKYAAILSFSIGTLVNQYYASYFIAFSVWAFLLFIVFRPKRTYAAIRSVRLVHALFVVTIIGLLAAPTALSYLHVKENFFLTNRSAQGTIKVSYSERTAESYEKLHGRLILPMNTLFGLYDGKYYESTSLVGRVAIPLAVVGVLVSVTQVPELIFLLMLTWGASRAWPDWLNHLNFILIPFYHVIRTHTFFSGYITLLLALFAVIGAIALVQWRTASRKAWWRLVVFLLVAAGILYIDQKEGFGYLWVYALLCLGFVLTWRFPGLSMMALGVVALFLVFEGDRNLRYFSTFTYQRQSVLHYLDGDGPFHFEFKRPDIFPERFIPIYEHTIYPDRNNYCCVTSINLAEKTDAPADYKTRDVPFRNDVLAHTNLITNQYHRLIEDPALRGILSSKILWFRYFAQAAPEDVNAPAKLVAQGILPVGSSGAAFPPDRRLSSAALSLPRERSAPAGSVGLVEKTANTVTFSVHAEEAAILLYTDQNYDGWEAELDGKRVPIESGLWIYKAVWVPAGDHRLVFAFRPPYRLVMGGYLLATCGFVIVICLGSIGWWVRSVVEDVRRIGRT